MDEEMLPVHRRPNLASPCAVDSQPFLNNDPLMDKRIVPRLELILRKNPRSRVCVTTTGFLLHKEIARALASMPLDKIHISSNGLTNEAYNATMGIRGSTVLRNVNFLWDEMRRLGSRTQLVVTAVLMKANRLEIQQSAGLLARTRCPILPESTQRPRLVISKLDKFAGMLPFQDWVNDSQTHCGTIRNCALPFTFMGILWNGDLVRCCMDWRRSKVLGNAAEDRLYDLWHGKRYEALRYASNHDRLHEVPALCRMWCEAIYRGLRSDARATQKTRRRSAGDRPRRRSTGDASIVPCRKTQSLFSSGCCEDDHAACSVA